MTPDNIFLELKTLRIRAGLTQEQLAKKIRVNKKTISNIEMELSHPRYDIIVMWATACEFTLNL